MPGASRSRRPSRRAPVSRSPVALIALGVAVPAVSGWDVHVASFPPLHAVLGPRASASGTLPAIAARASLGSRHAVDLADGCSLATAAARVVRRRAGLDAGAGPRRRRRRGRPHPRHPVRVPAHRARDHRPAAHAARRTSAGSRTTPRPSNWPVHVAGHPPGALLFFVGAGPVGLGGGVAAGLVVTVIAATTAVAVLVDAARAGRRGRWPGGPRRSWSFGPAAVWQARVRRRDVRRGRGVGLACLALAATRPPAVRAGLGARRRAAARVRA